jgi:four helix bundle protein
MERNIIVEKSIDFSLDIIDFCELLDSKRKYVLSKQLLKSGTSIGANIHEAQSAESRADFIHKLKISAKEANETNYWLILCNRSKHYPSNFKLVEDLLSIQKLLSSIISSAKRNSK